MKKVNKTIIENRDEIKRLAEEKYNTNVDIDEEGDIWIGNEDGSWLNEDEKNKLIDNF